MSISKSAYLPGLNTLRFFAAFLVIISHAQQSINKLNILNETSPIFQRGEDGVEFFFVLSGFLITYLLIKEIHKTGTVSIKDFYLRRVFRIWPLYFIIVIIGLVLLCLVYPAIYHKPYFNFPIWKWLTLFILFLPNLATVIFPMGLLHPLWSIGVEEQFYLFWAPLVKFFKNHLLKLILTFIVISSLWQFALEFLPYQIITKKTYGIYINGKFKILMSENWCEFFCKQKFYAMSIGSFFGYALFHWKERFQKSFFSNKVFQSILLVFVLFHLFVFISFAYTIAYKIILAIAFGLIIINTVCSETTIFKIEKKPFIYLGTISYGLYMYHMTIDYFLRTIFQKINFPINPYCTAIIYHILLLIITILVAGFSFKYLESYFLKLKEKFAS